LAVAVKSCGRKQAYSRAGGARRSRWFQTRRANSALASDKMVLLKAAFEWRLRSAYPGSRIDEFTPSENNAAGSDAPCRRWLPTGLVCVKEMPGWMFDRVTCTAMPLEELANSSIDRSAGEGISHRNPSSRRVASSLPTSRIMPAIRLVPG